MTTTTQVSAYISEETKAAVDAYVKRHGVKKGFLIEEALRYHLSALREIPADVMVPARLVLTEGSMAEVADVLAHEAAPTEALKQLLRD